MSTPAVQEPRSPSAPTRATAELPVVPARSDPLCRPRPVPSPSPGQPAGSLPDAFAQVARQVEQIRNLSYRSPVRARAVTAAEMARLVRADVSAQAPKVLVARTAKAWATIGVIPPRTDLYRAVLEFDTSQVLGFYDPKTRRLVFIGSPSPSAFQRFTLSHELTHALDDQRFDLRHLDQLQNCRDDEQGAYVALAEGDAVLTSVSWAQQHLTPAELLQVEREAGSGPRPPATVPRFVVDLMGFPYQFGPVFVETLQERGGSRAVDEAFRHPPTSTEQVLHPDRFPSLDIE